MTELQTNTIVRLSDDDLLRVNGLIDGVVKDYQDVKGSNMGENALIMLEKYRSLIGAMKSFEKFSNAGIDLLPKNVRWTILKEYPFFLDLHKVAVRVKPDNPITRNLSHVWVGVFEDENDIHLPDGWLYSPILLIKKHNEYEYELYGLVQPAILNLYSESFGKLKRLNGLDYIIKFKNYDEFLDYV